MSSTYASCSGAVEAAFAAVMRSAVRWAVDGEELRLDRPDGRGLRFRVRDSIYPTRELLRGQRGGGGYQFGWQAGSGLVSLRWAWRDGPGKPWGRRDEPQADPDGAAAGPAGGAAGTDWFVFGVVPRAVARVLCRPPGGRPAVALGCSPVPGARTWRAFGGFVDQTKGQVVVALDQHRRELDRSDPGS
jgi:hypothetical protein